MSKYLAITLAVALPAAPIPAHAQDITLKKGYINYDSWLTVPGVATEQRAAIVAPRNYAAQIRNGTLRELELAVPLGSAHDALARSHRSRAPIANLSVRVRDQTGAYLVVHLKNAKVTSYSINTSGLDDQDKFGRVKIQFQWDRGGAAQGEPLLQWHEDFAIKGNNSPPGQQPAGTPTSIAGSESQRPPGTGQPAAADLLPLNGLRLGSQLIAWGQTATISTDEAVSKQAGRCSFRYRYDTKNQGSAAGGPATNLILLNAPAGAALAQDALPGLAAAAQHISSGTLMLAPGTWTLYVHADGKQDVAEGDEQNNLRRVRVQVTGSCN